MKPLNQNILDDLGLGKKLQQLKSEETQSDSIIPKLKKKGKKPVFDLDSIPVAEDIPNQTVEDILNSIDDTETENTITGDLNIDTNIEEPVIDEVPVDDVTVQQIIEPNVIVETPSIEQVAIQKVAEKNQQERKILELKKRAELRKKKRLEKEFNQRKAKEEASKINNQLTKVQDISELTPVQKVENEELIQQLNVTNSEEIPTDVNILEIKDQVEDAMNDVPMTDDLSMDSFDIKVSEKKDKSGYRKTKVSLKKEGIPDIVNVISSYVKKQTNGLIAPRIMDFRVIGNTNKTQLRGSTLKLSPISIVFKPDSTKFKVNKGTRIAISVPENFKSTGNLLIYMQESRAKTIFEINRSEFESQEYFNEFIGDGIAQFYVNGFEVSKNRFILRKANNPLMEIVLMVTKTSDYKVKPYVDTETEQIYSFDIISKHEKNQWLMVNVIDGDLPGTYKITLQNRVDSGWSAEVTAKVPITIEYLRKNLINILNQNYNKDWGIEEKEDERIFYMLHKLTYHKLKNALIDMSEMVDKAKEDEIENNIPDLIGLKLGDTLSQKDTAKEIDAGYGAEAIVGKTNFVDYFILTYLAQQIIGGDKRKGKDYITTQDYYEKYAVKDHRDYQEREKTILKKEGNQRNYNSRPYMFQLEYSIKGKKCIYRSFDWEDVKETTKFLTDKPVDASLKSKY